MGAGLPLPRPRTLKRTRQRRAYTGDGIRTHVDGLVSVPKTPILYRRQPYNLSVTPDPGSKRPALRQTVDSSSRHHVSEHYRLCTLRTTVSRLSRRFMRLDAIFFWCRFLFLRCSGLPQRAFLTMVMIPWNHPRFSIAAGRSGLYLAALNRCL